MEMVIKLCTLAMTARANTKKRWDEGLDTWRGKGIQQRKKKSSIIFRRAFSCASLFGRFPSAYFYFISPSFLLGKKTFKYLRKEKNNSSSHSWPALKASSFDRQPSEENWLCLLSRTPPVNKDRLTSSPIGVVVIRFARRIVTKDTSHLP